jgi:uncharacterized protein (TIGR03437 family)
MQLRWVPAIFVLGWSSLAWAQTVTVKNYIQISFQHGAWGQPAQVWAGLVPGDPDGVGTITVTAEDGTKGQWTIEAMEFIGAGKSTWLNVSISDGANNSVQFYDSNATLMPDGRSGTFTKVSGTGAFHTASASISYNFQCIGPSGQCYSGSGSPTITNFLSSFLGGGFLTAVISTQPPPPPKPKPPSNTPAQDPNQTFSFTPGGNVSIVNVGSGSIHAVPIHQDAQASTSAGADGSMTITIPSQFAPVSYSAAASCANLPVGCWLSVPPPTTGALPPFTSGSIAANLDFGNLPEGVYPANVSVAITAPDGSIPPSTENSGATLIVTGAPPLQLSETAVALQTSAGATGQILHSLSLSSSEALAYQATASTLTGGNWLSVTPASGAVSAVENGSMGILVNPSGLAAGEYFGRVDINAPGAMTAWQSVEVELTVLAPGPALPIFSTTGLIFITPQGSFPPAQDVLVSTLSNQPMTVAAGSEDNNLAWFKVEASSTTLQAGQTIKQSVLVGNATLTPGVYPGSILESNGTLETPLSIVLIVTPPSGTCTPTQLIPVFTNLYGGFEFPAGLPVTVQAQIVDDCGSPLTSGTVLANFGPGDAPVLMTSFGNGQWTGTWLPHGTTPGPAAVGISAQSASGLQGSASLTGAVDANTTIPLVTPGGIVSAANPVSDAPIAPGQFISIYGINLATSNVSSPASSYQTTLAGTQVLLGGVPLPLQFVSSGLINAVVPFGIPINGIQELLIAQNSAYSLPETVVVASASPAIFTQDESGQGAGVIVIYKTNGTVYETSPTQPASAGDLLLVYCDGLGPVNPASADGAPAPSSPPFATTVSPVTATVGGVPAQVQFAGLAPGYIGVYQVNVTVPSGVSPGSNVPIVLTTSGFSSSPATVTIQ